MWMDVSMWAYEPPQDSQHHSDQEDEPTKRHERWGAGVETQKMYGERLGDGVEYHLMSPTPRR